MREEELGGVLLLSDDLRREESREDGVEEGIGGECGRCKGERKLCMKVNRSVHDQLTADECGGQKLAYDGRRGAWFEENP